MLIEVIVIGLVVQLFFWKQETFQIKYLPAIIICFFALLGLRLVISSHPEISQGIYQAQGFLILGLSLIFFLQKPRLAYIPFGLGLFLNGLMLSMYGRMPVDGEALLVAGQDQVLTSLIQNQSTTHFLMTGGIQSLLGDIIPLPKTYPLARVVSPGDILMSLGLTYLLIVRPIVKEREND